MHFQQSTLKDNSKFYFPKQSRWIFWLALILVAVIYNYPTITFFHPGAIHLWRQCDGLSFATNYYEEGMKFFSPKIHWSCQDGTGAATGEFPIIYYGAAFLWKIFGKHEFLFRLINLSILFSGLFYFFRFIEDQLKDSFWAILLTLLIFTSPVLVYYANNFLMDAPALGCVLAGWYFFGKFYSSGSQRMLYYSMLWFLIAGLLKISSEISFVIIAGIFLIETTSKFKFKKTAKIFENPRRELLPLLIPVVGIGAWYIYAGYYNSMHNPGVFLMNTLPMWNKTASEINAGLESFMGGQIVHQFFNIEALILVMCLFVFQFFYIRQINRFLFFVTVLLFFGVLGYSVLWFEIVTTHDYYLVMPLIFVSFTLLSFFSLLRKKHYGFFNSVILRVTFFIFLAFNVYVSAGKTAVKYFRTIPADNYPSCFSKEDISFIRWLKDDYASRKNSCREVSAYLRSLGIKRSDKVISLPDPSTNITLYFMDQKGFSGFDCPNPITSDWINSKIEAGAKYLILNDPELHKNEALAFCTQFQIGSYKNLAIYDLRKQSREVRTEKFYNLENNELLGNVHTIIPGDAFSGKNSCLLSEKDEYGVIIKQRAEDLADYEQIVKVELNAKIKMDESPKELLWVFQINDSKDSVLLWEGVLFKYNALKPGVWQSDTLTYSLKGLRLQKGASLNIFVWNKGKQRVSVDDLDLQFIGYK